MKRDKLHGSAEIETFGHICMCCGVVFFSIFGSRLIESTPKSGGTDYFYLTFTTSGLVLLSSLVYPDAAEDSDAHTTNEISFVKLKLQMFKQYTKVTAIRSLCIFFFVVSVLNINLEEFILYFDEENYGVGIIFEGYTMVILCAISGLLILLYATVLINRLDLKIITSIGLISKVISSLLFALQVSYPSSKNRRVRTLLLIQATLVKPLELAFLYIPGLI
jgi:hypothetical protein